MDVTVVANPDCGHCRHCVDVLADLAEREGVALSCVDVRRHPEAAERWRAECSPLVVFGDRVAYPGMPDAETFRSLARAS